MFANRECPETLRHRDIVYITPKMKIDKKDDNEKISFNKNIKLQLINDNDKRLLINDNDKMITIQKQYSDEKKDKKLARPVVNNNVVMDDDNHMLNVSCSDGGDVGRSCGTEEKREAALRSSLDDEIGGAVSPLLSGACWPRLGDHCKIESQSLPCPERVRERTSGEYRVKFEEHGRTKMNEELGDKNVSTCGVDNG